METNDRFEQWEVKARMLGIRDNFEINKEPRYKINAILNLSNKPKYYYEIKSYKGRSKNVTIPPVDRICFSAFEDNQYIETVKVDKQVEFIEPHAFNECYNLRKLDLSESNIRFLSNSIVANCTNLEEIKLNDNIDTIGTIAISRCKKLRKLEFNNLELIYSCAFMESGLETLIIRSENNLIIERDIIEHCNRLKKLVIDVEGDLIIDGELIKKNLISLEEVWIRPKHYSILHNHSDKIFHKLIRTL